MFTLTPTQHTDLSARVAAARSEGRAERTKRAARAARRTAIRCNSRDADLGDDLADLGEALKFAAVPGGITAMRRDYSGAAYAERGRTTVRLAPAKAAANRSARRSTENWPHRTTGPGAAERWLPLRPEHRNRRDRDQRRVDERHHQGAAAVRRARPRVRGHHHP